MSDSTSDSPKPSDRFDNSETKIQNRETCLESRFTVSSVVYRPPILTIDISCDRLDNSKLYLVFRSGFLIDHALSFDDSFITSSPSHHHNSDGFCCHSASLCPLSHALISLVVRSPSGSVILGSTSMATFH